MADNKTPREAFLELVQGFVSTDTSVLITNDKAKQNGILIFNELENPIKDLKDSLKLLTIENLNALPDMRFSLLQSSIAVLNSIIAIQSTAKNPNVPDAQQKNPTINKINELLNANRERIWNLVMEALTLYGQKSQTNTESKEKLRELNDTIASVKNAKNEFDKSISIYKREFESVIDSVKTELSKGGVGKHAEIFTTQSSKHGKNAEKWRTAFILLIILNFIDIGTFLGILLFKDSLQQAERIEIGVFGIALASLISYIIVICVKNFYAEKHNEVVNQHKANCLGTFNTFVDAADPDKKGAVLLQATQTIFSHQKSGYLSKDSDVSSPSPIIEILSKVAAK